MSRIQKSTNLYPHPFSRAYWRDAAAELKDTKMLVISALLIALRIALKPFAIPVGPSLYISPAMLATALGAMIFGPVVAIPAAIVSDTLGFLVFPNGQYFLPYVLTEIFSTLIYALCLYRAKPSALRVTLARFIICSVGNCILGQLIYAWQQAYLGTPEAAMKTVMGIANVARILKNVCFFPVESVVLTLFLNMVMPAVQRAKLIYTRESDLKFKPKQVIALVCLLVVGISGSVGYLTYRYNPNGEGKSRTADYSDTQRVEMNQKMTQVLLRQETGLSGETVVCIVDSAYRGFFDKDTDYTVSVYILDEEAFAAGQKADKDYTMDTLWGYSPKSLSKDPYGSLEKVATATFTMVEKTGEISDYLCKYIK